MDKSLKEKAINFKGKKYVLVADRVIFFNENYPNGAVTTELVSNVSGEVIVMATVIPDVKEPQRRFCGLSQAVKGDGYINKTSHLENCETSAVGRALAFMGIGVIDNIASVDEVNKALGTVNKIQNQKPFTPDEYEQANEVLPTETRTVVKEANKAYRTGTKSGFGKIASGERQKERLNGDL